MNKAFANKRWWICLLGLLLPLATALAQADYPAADPETRYLRGPLEVNEFDREQWEALKQDMNYRSELTPEEAEQRMDDGHGGEGEAVRRPRRRSGGSWFSSELWGIIFKFTVIVALAIGIALLIRYILGYHRPRNTKVARGQVQEIEIDRIEENLHESDLDAYIRRALAQEQYALAVRLYYLAVLKQLSLSRWIKWKKDKTNRDYLLEMRSRESYSEFAALTQAFERVWYGQNELPKRGYEQLEPRFRKFIEHIETPAKV